MNGLPDLYLYECVLLLALHDRKGTAQSGWYGYAVAGAVVADLVLAERLGVEQVRKAKMLTLRDPTPMGAALLDDTLARIGSARRRARVSTWVSRVANARGLLERAALRLVEKGLLERAEGRVLWVFPRITYPTRDPAPEARLVALLREAVEGEGETSPEVATLVSLAHGTGLLGKVLPPELLGRRRERVRTLARMDWAGAATREAVEAVHAALIATTASLTAVTAATSS